jgi:hypothetical protein
MSLPSVSSAVEEANPSGSSDTRLRGRWLVLARVAWLAIAAFCLVVFILGIPLNYADLGKVCTIQPCDQDPTPDSIARFHAAGLSLGFYSAYVGTIALISGLVYLVIAALIYWRKSNTWIGLLTSLFLITYAVSQHVGDDVSRGLPALAGPVNVLQPLGFVCLGLFLYLFPDGRFAPRWTRWVVRAWIPLFLLSANVLPDGGWVPLLFGFLVVSVYAQIYRYRRVSTLTQRQQTKWVVYGVLISILGFVGILVIGNVFGLGGAPGTFKALAADTLVYRCHHQQNAGLWLADGLAGRALRRPDYWSGKSDWPVRRYGGAKPGGAGGLHTGDIRPLPATAQASPKSD